MNDEKYMKLALDLAAMGCGFVNPNPMVGAVIVKDGEIIGCGYHEKYGEPHAERNALASCASEACGATLYVTLEPCCHFGRTPPCTGAIIESGISKVVMGASDPNPLVSGKGAGMLRQHGIEVAEGVLEQECRKLNEVFFHYITKGTPFVVMKYAMTMDGKIAAYTGKSKWITGEAARHKVHMDRHRFSAVMVGVGTVTQDDPLLTCRLENGRDPVRIICDTHLRTPLDSSIVTTAIGVPTIIATSCMDEERQRGYAAKGCKIITVSEKGGYIDLNELMTELGREKIDSVLLEGGGSLNWSALSCGIVNRVQAYVSPKILGGADAKTPVAGIGAASPDSAFLLTNSVITQIEGDILIESDVVQKCSLG
ncbi:MAG: bifunctional diaminohydroxyphosphoribosylaminopyrimidine deaminase/5-amino-6-(5-phosphoribosylamino)uracil reductase RibD [Clostridiales bacterium]|nr:bifunctional diaminohydroxyphosphoribosylaminopyrimidine deaminase/5-amino-6-(5-phosphoribosylamino)uracil reductase RibD [Clostridiales bacterium]